MGKLNGHVTPKGQVHNRQYAQSAISRKQIEMLFINIANYTDSLLLGSTVDYPSDSLTHC